MANERLELEKFPEFNGMLKDLDLPPVDPWHNGGYQSSYDDNDNDKLNLREYWRRIRRHKWLILSIVIIVTTLVTIQAYRIKEWYVCSTVLEIGKENSIAFKSGDITLNDGSDPNYINTKLLAFENADLYEQAVRDLKLDQNAAIIEKINYKPVLSSARLLELLGISRSAATSNAPPTPPPPVDGAKDSLRYKAFTSYVQRSVGVEQVKNTRAIRLSFTDEDPELASKIVNKIAEIFLQNSFNQQTEKFTNSVDWLDSSTRDLKAKVQAAEEALTDYTRENQIYSTTGSGSANGAGEKEQTLTTNSLVQLHGQFVRAQTDRILKKSLYDQVQAGRVSEIPEAFTDPKINAAKQQLAALQTQAASLKVKFGPINPRTQEVQNQIAVLTTQIEQTQKELEAKLKGEYERAVKDEQSLDAALNTAKLAAVNENQAAIKFDILKQDVETARTIYTDFLQKTNQAKLQVAEQDNNIKVIQAASPGGPAGPKRLTIILTGFFLSLGAGIGLALLLEHLDNTIKTLDDVEQYVMLPTLGVIPTIASPSVRRLKAGDKKLLGNNTNGHTQLALQDAKNETQTRLMNGMDSSSIIGESYRALRTSLLLSAAGTPPKSILITSGQASEGKTTTAVNTAISLSQLGAKVILIDCDLRRPSIHKQLDLNNTEGITNYLSSNIELDALVRPLSIPNLSVITSGPLPPNPAELLSSKKMREMLQLLGGSYDHVVLDSPPIVNVTDPVILSTLVDGTVLVIQAGKSTRELVRRSRQELFSVRAKVFGVVLNNVHLHKDGSEYYYYYRYSQYYKSADDDQS